MAAVAWKQRLADAVVHHYGAVSAAMRTGLKIANACHRLLGDAVMDAAATLARKVSGNRTPAWNAYMPTGIAAPKLRTTSGASSKQVVYFPSCVNTTMGPAAGDPDSAPLYRVIYRVLQRAGFGVVVPPQRGGFCCGTPFASKGFDGQADMMAAALNSQLLEASENGRIPVLCDTAPCVQRMRQTLDARLAIFEPFEFIHSFLIDHLTIVPVADPVAIHITCSSRKMGLEGVFRHVAQQLAAEAVFPESVTCCGWAGDRGFNFPELTASALAQLGSDLQGRCSAGYSNSRTCEIGLSQHSGIYYKSIFYLLDRCSR